MGLVPKYYLLTADTSQVSIFFLTSDKNDNNIYPLNYLLLGLMLTMNKVFTILSTLPVLG